MHLLSFLAEYWWAVAAGIVLVVVGFVLVAGRGAEGGFGGRTRQGWQKWKALGDRVANVQARILLTLFYFTVMAPIGLWQSRVADRLALRRTASTSFWVERSTRDRTLEDARRQF